MITLKKWVVNPFQECSYVLSDKTREAVIVDCGMYYPFEREQLMEYIETEHLRPVHLLLTHAHHDHVYGNDLIHDHFGLLPEVHEADKLLMTEQLKECIDDIYYEYPYPLPMPEHYLRDGEMVRFGNHELKVIHTPGHTPGSVFFYCEKADIAFSGDTLFYKGIGRSDLPGGNKEELYSSLKSITDMLPNNTVIYPGHDRDTAIGYEKANNPYLVHKCDARTPIGTCTPKAEALTDET